MGGRTTMADPEDSRDAVIRLTAQDRADICMALEYMSALLYGRNRRDPVSERLDDLRDRVAGCVDNGNDPFKEAFGDVLYCESLDDA